jgi:SAM-dependent methyltransferase
VDWRAECFSAKLRKFVAADETALSSPSDWWNLRKMSAVAKPNHAFGVDPTRPERYSLRQSRYDALAEDVSRWAGEAAAAGSPLRVLDIGCGTGVSLRYIEARPHFEAVRLSGADVESRPRYREEAFEAYYVGDLMQGYPEIPSGSFDVVLCEQVLEHLPRLEVAIATLERVLRPGGKLIVGVPIFPPPLAYLRRHLVPHLDRAFQPGVVRGHVQAFSARSFLTAMAAHSQLRLLEIRGFRIVSGGLLKPLENHRWWWRFNRRLGRILPSLCIEIQAVMERPRH